MKGKAFTSFAWAVFGLVSLTIILGAVVRITGSGAGCGNQWPLCAGQILPPMDDAPRLIEYTHRMASGISFILVLVLFVLAWRRREERPVAFKGALLAMSFMVIEAGVGASLVLFELVARNTSTARALVSSLHLVNSLLLVASVAATAWYGTGNSVRKREQSGITNSFAATAAFLLLTVSATGALAALGSTLFPAESLSLGLSQDFLSSSPILLRLRISHPILSLLVGIYLLAALQINRHRVSGQVRELAGIFAIALFCQLILGAITLFSLSPIPLQLAHLALGLVTWTLFVLLAVETRFERITI